MKALACDDAKPDKKQVADEIRRLTAAVVRGDQTAVPKLQAISKRKPITFARVLAGDLPELARHMLIGHEIKDSPELYDAAMARLAMVGSELAGADPSPARRLAAELAAYSWAETWLLNMKAGAGGIERQSVESTRRQTASMRRTTMGLKMVAQIAALESRPKRAVQRVEE